MPSCGRSVSAYDVRCLQEREPPFTISSGHIDLEFGTRVCLNLSPAPNQRIIRSETCSLLDLHRTCPVVQTSQSIQASQFVRTQTLKENVVVTQPVSRIRLSDEDWDRQLPLDRPSLSDIAQFSQMRYNSEDSEGYHYSGDPRLFQGVRAYDEPYDIEDDLIMIDGQIAVKDSNVDPILCRLRRQQLVAGTRRKESSVATDMLEAERVRFNRCIDVREINEGGKAAALRMLTCCFRSRCCPCRRRPQVGRQLAPVDSILATNKRRTSDRPSLKSTSV
ncbi:hypothetical protein ElyMa_004985400 [Elysia marginata]|uniref:Uncharacterized protein n=1 Tax=Elysia marginata TaxID=1093978 RepID=A0AAV4J5K6_9GAST|nr:hypothetical protein ElyMa_004985400 [Elysia marginata]